MKKRMSRFWSRPKRLLILFLLIGIPALWLTAMFLPLRRGFIGPDGVFILVILTFLAIGASLSVVKLGDLKKSWIHWLQGAALVTVLGVMFAACKSIGKLLHAKEASDFINRYTSQWWGLSELEPQWSLFLVFAVLFATAMVWLFLLGRWLATKPDRGLDAFRYALGQRMEKWVC